MSELLFWEFNASIMTVDDGIDIVASKGGRFFHIQVKTSAKPNNEKYSFIISKTSFNRYEAPHVYYVFVMRQKITNEYIIIPSMQLHYFIKTDVITDGASLSLTISANQQKTKYTLNGKADITPYYGKFGEIIK